MEVWKTAVTGEIKRREASKCSEKLKPQSPGDRGFKESIIAASSVNIDGFEAVVWGVELKHGFDG